MKPLSAITWAFAVATAAIYFVMIYTRLDPGIKWPLLGIHMLTACLGFLASLFEVAQKRWIAFIPMIICGFFVYIQLLTGLFHS